MRKRGLIIITKNNETDFLLSFREMRILKQRIIILTSWLQNVCYINDGLTKIERKKKIGKVSGSYLLTSLVT